MDFNANIIMSGIRQVLDYVLAINGRLFAIFYVAVLHLIIYETKNLNQLNTFVIRTLPSKGTGSRIFQRNPAKSLKSNHRKKPTPQTHIPSQLNCDPQDTHSTNMFEASKCFVLRASRAAGFNIMKAPTEILAFLPERSIFKMDSM